MQLHINDRIIVDIPNTASGFILRVDGKPVARLQSFCLAADVHHIQTLRALTFARSPSGGPDQAALHVLEEAGFSIQIYEVDAPPNPFDADDASD